MRSDSVPVLPVEDPGHPGSDGKPMAENDWHLHGILGAFAVLKNYYEDNPNVVAGFLSVVRGHGHS